MNSKDAQLASGMLDLFDEKPLRPKSKQHGFDTRKILDVEFFCIPVSSKNGGRCLVFR